MSCGRFPWALSQACRWLAGLEAGVWAGVAMLGWCALTAAWSQHSVWAVPSRLGTLFYPDGAWQSGYGAATSAGLALHLFTSGVVGMAFGSVAREGRNRVRVSLLGILTGLVWYYVSYALFWKRLLPAPSNWPPPAMMPGYLVFGLVLGCYPGRLRSAERHWMGGRAPLTGRDQPPAAPRG